MSFVLTEPRAPEVPVIVEVPHAGLEVDAESLDTLVAPALAIGRDAALYVEELYGGGPEAGATLLGSSNIAAYVPQKKPPVHSEFNHERAEDSNQKHLICAYDAENSGIRLGWRI